MATSKEHKKLIKKERCAGHLKAQTKHTMFFKKIKGSFFTLLRLWGGEQHREGNSLTGMLMLFDILSLVYLQRAHKFGFWHQKMPVL